MGTRFAVVFVSPSMHYDHSNLNNGALLRIESSPRTKRFKKLKVCIDLRCWPAIPRAAIPKGRHSEGPPFSAICSSDNLRLGIRLGVGTGLGLGLGSVVWLWQYQELFPATTMNDGFQNSGPFRNGGLSEWRIGTRSSWESVSELRGIAYHMRSQCYLPPDTTECGLP